MVWVPTFFGRGLVWAPTFLVTPNLRLKNFWNFFLYRAHRTEFFRGGLANFSWSCQIWDKKFFGIFSFTDYCGLWIFHRGGLGQLFLVMPNLRPKNFSEFFHLQSPLNSEFFTWGSLGTNFFWSCQITAQNFLEFFLLPSTLDWIFQRGVPRHQFFLVMPNLTPKIFQNFFLYQALWTEFSEGVWAKFFWSCQIWDQKIFGIFSFTEYCALWIFHRGYLGQLIWWC